MFRAGQFWRDTSIEGAGSIVYCSAVKDERVALVYLKHNSSEDFSLKTWASLIDRYYEEVTDEDEIGFLLLSI